MTNNATGVGYRYMYDLNRVEMGVKPNMHKNVHFQSHIPLCLPYHFLIHIHVSVSLSQCDLHVKVCALTLNFKTAVLLCFAKYDFHSFWLKKKQQKQN